MYLVENTTKQSDACWNLGWFKSNHILGKGTCITYCIWTTSFNCIFCPPTPHTDTPTIAHYYMFTSMTLVLLLHLIIIIWLFLHHYQHLLQYLHENPNPQHTLFHTTEEDSSQLLCKMFGSAIFLASEVFLTLPMIVSSQSTVSHHMLCISEIVGPASYNTKPSLSYIVCMHTLDKLTTVSKKVCVWSKL